MRTTLTLAFDLHDRSFRSPTEVGHATRLDQVAGWAYGFHIYELIRSRVAGWAYGFHIYELIRSRVNGQFVLPVGGQ